MMPSSLDMLFAFDCGDTVLNDYLLDQAKKNQVIHSVGVTYLARDLDVASSTILGYHTLAVANVPKEPIRNMFDYPVPPYHVVPCVLLARLAVQKDVQGKGIGGTLLKHAFNVALTVKASVGCRLMIVDAYQSAVRFYEQYGFLSLAAPKHNGTAKMFMDLLTVEAAAKQDESSVALLPSADEPPVFIADTQ